MNNFKFKNILFALSLLFSSKFTRYDYLVGFEVLSSGDYEEYYLLGYNAMQSVESRLTVSRHIYHLHLQS
jgi:hypothetical protein